MSSKLDQDRAARLTAERRRLGLSQRAAAIAAGCGEQAWIRYEKGQGMKQDVVDALQAQGWNMVWVVFGDDAPALLPDHDAQTAELLSLWRSVHPDQRAGLLLLVRTYAAAHPMAGVAPA